MADLTPANGGLPNPDNYLLGRGILKMDIFNDSNQRTHKLVDLGNVNSFTMTLEEETIDHNSSRKGLKTIDASITLSKSAKGSFQADELTENILALFTSGIAEQEAAANVVAGSLLIPANAGGHWVELWSAAIDPSNPAGGERLINGVFAISGGGWGTPVTDYVIDDARGQIFIVEGAALDTGADVWLLFDYTYAGETVTRVRMLQKTVVRGALVFSGSNAQTGEKYEVRLHKVKLQSDGDLDLISEDFANAQFAFTVEEDLAYDPDSPVGTITKMKA